MYLEEPPPPMAPLDGSEPYALRMTLIRRFRHLVLKFSPPPISRSGRHEASWIGGDAVADTEAGLLASVLEAMGDCGSEGHQWVPVSENRDPGNSSTVLLTRRLECAFCDEREEVVTVCRPHPTKAQAPDSSESPSPASGRNRKNTE